MNFSNADRVSLVAEMSDLKIRDAMPGDVQAWLISSSCLSIFSRVSAILSNSSNIFCAKIAET